MAFFQVQTESVYRIDGKVAMQVKFKSNDGLRTTPTWQYWECESTDETTIQQCLQSAADEWESRPVYDSTVPELPTNTWEQVTTS